MKKSNKLQTLVWHTTFRFLILQNGSGIYSVSLLLLFVYLPVLSPVPHRARVPLHNTIFSNINTVIEEEMAVITFGIYKVVFDLPVGRG
jgi:hypothetical protein